MKNFLIIFLFIIISFPTSLIAAADDIETSSTGDLWDNWNTREEGREAKPVSDEDFDKALEQADKKINKWKHWAENRKKPKGQEFSQSNETEVINNEQEKNDNSLPVLTFPFELKAGEDYMPVGHYQLKGEKIDGQPVFKFYQGNIEMAQFPAEETNDDFGEETISFAKWTPENDNEIKVMFGSMDFNAYSIIRIKIPQDTNL